MKNVGDKVLIVKPHASAAKKWHAQIDEIEKVTGDQIHLKKTKKQFRNNGKSSVVGAIEEVFPFPQEVEQAIFKWSKRSPFAAGLSGLEMNELAFKILNALRDNQVASN